MKWLITGGCGFIGTNLIGQLLRQGVSDIRIIDNLSVGSRVNLEHVTTYEEKSVEQVEGNSPIGVELIVADIMDSTVAPKVGHDVDVLVHLAANTGVGPSVEDPMLDCRTNVIGTLNYLECARTNQIPRFIFASSGAPAGEVTPPIHEEIVPKPVSPYGSSKLAGEGYCSSYYRSYGINTVALRFGNVYGPGSLHKNSVVAKFINKALAGEKVEIYGDGSQTRDFIYISDLIQAVLLASAKDSIGGEIFQIATSRETTVSELVEELRKVLSAANIKTPQLTHTEKRVGDVMRNYSDTSKARDRLDWINKIELDVGLRKTVEHFLEKRAYS